MHFKLHHASKYIRKHKTSVVAILVLLLIFLIALPLVCRFVYNLPVQHDVIKETPEEIVPKNDPEDVPPQTEEESLFNWKMILECAMGIIVMTAIITVAIYYKRQRPGHPPYTIL